MTQLKQPIDYIEIGVYNSTREDIGLLSSYEPDNDSLFMIPKKIGDSAYIGLKYCTVTFIKVFYEAKIEEYFFQKHKGDQDEAKQVLVSLIDILKADGRCAIGNHISVESYKRVSGEYKSSRVSQCCIDTSTHVIGGSADTNIMGMKPRSTTTAVGGGTITTYHGPKQLPQTTTPVSKIVFIKRTMPLPKKADLKALEKIISEGVFKDLPDTTAMDAVEDAKTTAVGRANAMYDDDEYANYMAGGYF